MFHESRIYIVSQIKIAAIYVGECMEQALLLIRQRLLFVPYGIKNTIFYKMKILWNLNSVPTLSQVGQVNSKKKSKKISLNENYSYPFKSPYFIVKEARFDPEDVQFDFRKRHAYLVEWCLI